MIAKLIFAGVAAGLFTAGGAFATTYDFTTLDVPGAQYTFANGINYPGAVRVDYVTELALASPGFVDSGGTYTTLEYPGSGESNDTTGVQINDSGVVIGKFNTVAFSYSGGSGGTYTEIDYPKSTMTVASGINATGVIAGYYTTGLKALASGYVYSDGTYTRIKYPKSKDTYVTAIDTSGAVAGYYIKGSQEFGFADSGGKYTRIKFPKSSETVVEAMSPSGALAGYYLEENKEYGFMYSGGTYTRLRFPGSTQTNATAINASGEVAGDYVKGSEDESFGFVYSDGTYATISIPGATETYVTGINANGQVTGRYFEDSAYFGFIATPQAAAINMTPAAVVAAPEPSTWAMLLSGFAGLGLVGYGKARSETSAFRA